MDRPLPVTGVSESNRDAWESIIRGYRCHGNVCVSVKDLKTFFGDSKCLGFLASILILKSIKEEKDNGVATVLEQAAATRGIVQLLYRIIKDQTRECPESDIFDDCLTRFCDVLNNECSCVDCNSTIKCLKNASLRQRAPRLDPHSSKNDIIRILNAVYTKWVLKQDLGLDLRCFVNTIVSVLDFCGFEENIRRQLRMLSACMYFTWLFFILKNHVFESEYVLHDNISESYSTLFGKDGLTHSGYCNIADEIHDLVPSNPTSYHLYNIKPKYLDRNNLSYLSDKISGTDWISDDLKSDIMASLKDTLVPTTIDGYPLSFGNLEPITNDGENVFETVTDECVECTDQDFGEWESEPSDLSKVDESLFLADYAVKDNLQKLEGPESVFWSDDEQDIFETKNVKSINTLRPRDPKSTNLTRKRNGSSGDYDRSEDDELDILNLKLKPSLLEEEEMFANINSFLGNDPRSDYEEEDDLPSYLPLDQFEKMLYATKPLRLMDHKCHNKRKKIPSSVQSVIKNHPGDGYFREIA